ncbi:hypothetical protein QP172_10175 [Corynebacterium coyleae]|uniref:hypothetical protein n=1 Tax=Corynebacterium coyleae TaxID=53374 RepID=UPI00254CEA42|nr:hypothetical protein [Corynebacterium coyleae]MDK6494087.1 hypothetical protein [Corynebacterium coyleae]
MAIMGLSSLLMYNIHHGAQDFRNALGNGAADAWLPASWQASLNDLSHSVVALWDSVINAISIIV